MKSLPSLRIGIALVAGILVLGATAYGQSLQLRYTFEDSGTTTTNDSTAALGPVVLNMVSAAAAAADLHGAAGTGIQGQGKALNISTNPLAGNVNGAYALTTANSALGGLGLVTNFTATIWFKLSGLVANLNNQGSRLFVLATNTVTDDGGINSLGMNFGLGTGGAATYPANTINLRIGNTAVVASPIYYNFPTNQWLFLAMTYDTVSGLASLYYGSEAAPAKLYTVKNVGVGTNFNFSGSASLAIGNRIAGGRDFPGWLDEFRFYTGAGDANFIENIRQSSTPVVVSNLTPDGSVLMSGTNTLSFTAASPNGIDPSGIAVSVNGVDVSSSLVVGGTASSRTVTYPGLPVNPTVVSTTNINGVGITIHVTDQSGVSATSSYAYDAFAPDNFTWEGEDYDFNGGGYADVLTNAFNAAINPYYQAAGVQVVDYNDQGANSAAQSQVYRSISDIAATEYSLGAGNNGGNSIGELMRQKVRDALAKDPNFRDVDLGYFDGPATSGGSPVFGTPNWVNYTHTYPTGAFNIYVRAAFGGSSGGSTLSQVTSGWGTPTQTTTNLGIFPLSNTGGWATFAWVPLRDSGGNLVRVLLGGTNTLQLTANAGGGGNINFLMLTPANTNLPVITDVYPNGTNMFQPAAALTFTVSSPAGISIGTNSIKVVLTTTTVISTTTTNLTATNGLVITGSVTNRSVSAPLIANANYTAVISAIDANGSPAGTTVHFDTYNPSYTWEAEDYDHDNGGFIDNPAPDAYAGLPGVQFSDAYVANIGEGTVVYRPSGMDTEINGDQQRLAYIGTGFTDYDVGWNDSGNWGNYTRTYPAGAYNIYMRAANGSTGAGGATLSDVTSGVGTTNQTVVALGSFAVPPTGGWQNYVWSPMRDTGGNLVKFTGGSKHTLRVTSGGGYNANFYALFPANTNLPVLAGVYPDGTTIFQSTNALNFSVLSSAGVSTNSIVVTVNGTIVTNVIITGSSTNWAVRYPHLASNQNYSVILSATDVNGNNSTTTVTFDTFSSANYTWEAEDFDHDGGQFIDNPQTNAYAGLGAVVNVDTHQVNFAGTYLYRTNGMDTEINADLLRPAYQGTGQSDYTAGYYSSGAWMNYTRHFPAGTYNVYGRLAAGGGDTVVNLSQLTSGWGTTTQTSNLLGSFAVANAGWETYHFTPLRDSQGNLVPVTLDGSTNTLQLIKGVVGDGLPDCNANFLMLVPIPSPIMLSAAPVGTNLVISFASQSAFSYQLLYKNSLSDPAWLPLGAPVPGNNGIQSISDPLGSSNRFYRVQIQ